MTKKLTGNMEAGKELLKEFLSKESNWKMKIVTYQGEQYEVPKTMTHMFIQHSKEYNTSIVYCTNAEPRWDNHRLEWKKRPDSMFIEVRPFEGVIPFLASKASLEEIE